MGTVKVRELIKNEEGKWVEGDILELNICELSEEIQELLESYK